MIGNGLNEVFSKPFLVRVQAGQIPGYSIISKFAANPAIASATPADIWDYAPEPIYTFSTSAAIDSISCADNSATQNMLISGLDANYLLVDQVIVLTGQTRVALTTPLIRVHRVFNADSTDLPGDVYVYENTAIVTGVPTDTTKVRAFVNAPDNQTLMGVFTVPANSTGFFLGLSTSLSRRQAGVAIFTGKVRGFGGVFRTQIRYALNTLGTSYNLVPPTASSRFPEKTDFVAHAEVDTNDIGVSVTFDLLMIENDKL